MFYFSTVSGDGPCRWLTDNEFKWAVIRRSGACHILNEYSPDAYGLDVTNEELANVGEWIELNVLRGPSACTAQL